MYFSLFAGMFHELVPMDRLTWYGSPQDYDYGHHLYVHSFVPGKTTQLQIIMGKLQPDSGEVVKAKKNMRIAYLAQEFDVVTTR